MGGARRRYLTALANNRQSCGSALMFGKTVCRTSRPSSESPPVPAPAPNACCRRGSIAVHPVHAAGRVPSRREAAGTTSGMIRCPTTVGPGNSRSSTVCACSRPEPAQPDRSPRCPQLDQPRRSLADVEQLGDHPTGLVDVGMRRPRHVAGDFGIGRDRGEQLLGVVEPGRAQCDPFPVSTLTSAMPLSCTPSRAGRTAQA